MEIASQITTSVSARYPSQKTKVVEDVTSPNNYTSRSDSENEAKEKAAGVNKVKEPSQAEKSNSLKDPHSEESLKLNELKERDSEVRRHEQAHLSAAGAYAKGAPSFTYQRGSDGRQYAVGGEVQIDTSKVHGDPEATLQKARAVQRAALAPSEPSGQDRAVASQAAMMAVEAQSEISAEKESLTAEEPKTSAVKNDQHSLESSQQIANQQEAAARFDKKLSDMGINLKTSEILENSALSVFA